MKRGSKLFLLVGFSICLFFNIGFVLSIESSISDEMQRITYYAEQYETGNIDYVKLITHIGSIREKLNEIFGVVNREEGGLLKQEQIQNILGEPNEESKWIWVENQERERKLSKPLPIWRKIVFDGNEIQIKMEAFPSIFVRGEDYEDYEFDEEDFDEERFEEDEDHEEEIVYRLNFDIEFKRSEDQLDIKSKIDDITELAKEFSSNPSPENAEILAKESVDAEMAFNNNFRQGGGECVGLMNSIFGSENKRATQKTLEQEIIFYEGDNFEAILRLDMCEDCEWHWINMDLRIEGRGPGFNYDMDDGFRDESKRYGGKSFDEFKVETTKIVENLKRDLDGGDFGSANSKRNTLFMLTEAWNRQSNDLWDQVQQDSEKNFLEQENSEDRDPYFWIKEDQRVREEVKLLQDHNYELRKQFYSNLFSGYPIKESYYEQEEWEKRLVEEFKEFGEETCDNNIDDNDNDLVDCQDDQCGGKICGFGEVEVNVGEGNETIIESTVLYCIAKECIAKEEVIVEEGPICGNNICELAENGEGLEIPGNLSEEELEKWSVKSGYCPSDCVQCPVYDAVECTGQVIFSGQDESGCPLPPICIEEKTCAVDEECNFRCGVGECVKGICEVVELIECREQVCVDGEQLIEHCNNGDELVTSICTDGLWSSLNVECPDSEERVCCRDFGPVDEPIYKWTNRDYCQSPEGSEFGIEIVDDNFCEEKRKSLECLKCGDVCVSIEDITTILCLESTKDFSCIAKEGLCIVVEEEIFGNECVIKEDCGGKHDVCSNGKCVPIPEIIETENKCVNVECQKGYKCVPSTGDCREVEEYEIFVAPPEKPVEEVVGEPDGEIIGEEPAEEIIESQGVPEESVNEIVEEEPEIIEETSEELIDITGNFIFRFFGAIANVFSGRSITGNAITGFQVDDTPVEDVVEDPTDDTSPDDQVDDVSPEDVLPDEGSDSCPDAGEPPEVTDECWYEETYDDNGCVSGYDYFCDGDFREKDDYYEERDKYYDGDDYYYEEDRRERENNCKEDCDLTCDDIEMRPCVEKCVYGEDRRGEPKDLEVCKVTCSNEIDISNCVNSCNSNCIEGKWDEFYEQFDQSYEEDFYREEKGVFNLFGSCRVSQGRTEGFLNFGGWGEPFDDLENYKYKYYEREGDWCKWELENSIKKRKEVEKGLNEEFAKWFFEDNLANSAEDWEQKVSGLYELYWNNVDNSRRIAENMRCLNKNDITEIFQPILINFEYESEYGHIEYWEELKEVRMPGFKEKVKIVSPYMKLWILPTKEFIKYELKKSMEEHEFPGSPEDKIERENEGFPSEDDIEDLRDDDKFMRKIRKISDAFGGNFNGVIQVKDFDKDELLYNLHVVINENVVMKVTPLLPSEIPEEDVRIEIDFEKLYDMILYEAKNFRGSHIESPPWDRRLRPVERISDVAKGIRMYFKARSMINSAIVTPDNYERDIKSLIKEMMKLMGDHEDDRDDEFEGGFEDLTEEEKEILREDFGNFMDGKDFGDFRDLSDRDLDRIERELGDEKFEEFEKMLEGKDFDSSVFDDDHSEGRGDGRGEFNGRR